MMRKLFYALLVLGLTLPASSKAETVARIAAVVNNKVITQRQFEDRLTLVLTASGINNNDEARQKMGPQILRNLIEEELRQQEADRMKITVSPEEIDQGFEMIAQQNNFSAEQFKALMQRSGVKEATLRDQIKTQIAWTKLLKTRLAVQVKVDEAEVQAFLNRLKANIGKPQYLLAEIFLPVDDPAQEANVREFGNRLIADMHKGARFSSIARQFSQSATARNGGDMGWVMADDLSSELNAELPKLQSGQVSAPIRTLRGYTILMVRERREITEDALPGHDDVFNMIGNQKLDVIQRRVMRDLRSDAIIDIRQ